MDPTLIPPVLWDWAKTTGPAGFALIVWWLERRERLDQQKTYQARNDALVDRLEKVARDATLAVQSLKDLLVAGRGKRD